jgi:GAF domain-containing protein
MDAHPVDGVAPTLVAAMHDLATMMAAPVTVAEILDRVGRHCAELLPVDAVGVLLHDPAGGGLSVATASSSLGRAVEELEAALDEGPCSEAYVRAAVVKAPDLEQARDRYPRFAPAALERGVRSVHAIPMVVRADHVGSLDLIARDPVALDDDQLAVVQLLADVVTSYIVNTRLLDEQSQLADQLRRALDSRVVIEQAKGVLAERHGIDVDEAFQRIRARARSQRVRAADVAMAVVDGRVDLPVT